MGIDPYTGLLIDSIDFNNEMDSLDVTFRAGDLVFSMIVK